MSSDSSRQNESIQGVECMPYADRSDFTLVRDEPIGSGTHASIYLAKHLPSDQVVALKVPRYRRNMSHEAELLATLHDPNLTPLLFCSEPNADEQFIAMPVFCTIYNLNRRDKLEVLTGAASALDYMHSQNVKHGDIKSANILSSDTGSGVLADLGLALSLEDLVGAWGLAPDTAQQSMDAMMALDRYDFAEAACWIVLGMHASEALVQFPTLVAAISEDHSIRPPSAKEFIAGFAAELESAGLLD